MNTLSTGKKTWCQRIKAAIILEGAILLVAAFILWENTAGAGGKTVAATSDGTIRWVDFNVSYEALCKAYECDEYYGAAEPPVRCGESHLSGLTEPLRSL